ncbi:FUSC family protein OS=Streptomyces lavendulae subsp. lavendulae OX=58340 GN=SLAV_01470 PE=4 SV=1 [Streptomyces lavendulae subsp. lavendulae]
MNPRVREGLMFRLVLRTGLDTLEICAVVLRVSARALTDLAKAREDEPLFSPAVTRALRDLFGHMALAVHSFSRLITAQVTTNAEEQEERLTRELGMARESRDLLASLLLEQLRTAPAQWQLHGALLADVDRVLDELDVDKRSHRLMEELDRHSRLRRGRGGRLPGVLRRRG